MFAGHRKVTDCYLITAAGARKLAGCGFRESVLPVDDFLPAVHVASTHPRADVMALPCVRKVCVCVCVFVCPPGASSSFAVSSSPNSGARSSGLTRRKRNVFLYGRKRNVFLYDEISQGSSPSIHFAQRRS